MELISSFIAQAQKSKHRVVLPEGADERIALAARQIKDQQIADPIVLGKPDAIAAAAAKAGVSLDDIETINPRSANISISTWPSPRAP